MSIASHRLSSRAVSRAASARDAGLKLVAPVRRRAARVPFVVVMIGVVAGGLLGLVLLSTVLQAQAFTISDLTRKQNSLVMQQQQLAEQVDDLQSPENLATKAGDLGMIPQTNPTFLRLSDGAVLGVPKPAGASR